MIGIVCILAGAFLSFIALQSFLNEPAVHGGIEVGDVYAEPKVQYVTWLLTTSVFAVPAMLLIWCGSKKLNARQRL